MLSSEFIVKDTDMRFDILGNLLIKSALDIEQAKSTNNQILLQNALQADYFTLLQ